MPCPCHAPASIDTLIVVGGEGTRATSKDRAHGEVRRPPAARRPGAWPACVRAHTYSRPPALLDGRAATTHWTRSSDFAQKFPRVKLDADRIFVKAGKFWSSAGITAGIDLSLALIAEDVGEAVARKVAQQLRGLLPPAWRPVAVLDAARTRTRRRTIRAAARLRAHQPARAAVGR